MANIFGTSDDDNLVGTGNDDYISGGNGSDAISGSGGDDRIEGFGSFIGNSSFDLDLDQTGASGQVPLWEVSGGGSASVQQTDGNGELILSNNGIAGSAGNSAVFQSTGVAYNPNEDFEFAVATKNVGSGLTSSQIQLEIYVKDATGNLTLIADSGPENVASGLDAKGYLTQYNVSTQDDGVNVPAGLGGEIVVKINQVSGAANSEKLIITDTSLTTTDLTAFEDGNDTIDGGAGDDLILGQKGDDMLSGGDDNDEVLGGAGNDIVNGDAGNDVLIGNMGDDTIDGGDGDDLLFGDGFATNPPENSGTFFGGPEANGWNFSAASQGDFQINESTGAIFLDTNGINGSSGGEARVANSLGERYDHTESYTVRFDYAALPNDVATDKIVVRILLENGKKLENIVKAKWDSEGGATQEYSFQFGPRPDFADLDGSEMKIQIVARADAGDGTDPNKWQGVWINNVEVSSTDPLWGIQSNVDLTEPPVNGVDNNDILFGGAGNDQIFGMEGDDTIDAGDGDDIIEGGAGNDTITIGLGDKVVSDDVYDGATNNITDAGVAGYDKDTIIIDGAATGTSNIITVDGGTGTTTGNEADDFDTLDWSQLTALHGKPSIRDITMDADGNSYSGTAVFTTSTGETITVNFTEFEAGVPCFVRGTMIEGKNGPVAVEDIKAGDLIMTKDHGLKPVLWISSRRLSITEAKSHAKLFPVRISAGALGQGLPERDLYVSPQHRMLVRSNPARRLVGTYEVLIAAKDLVAIEGIDFVTDFDEVEYIHFMFDQHEVVIAEGAETESLYAGPQVISILPKEVREEVLALFPELEGLDISEVVPYPARDVLEGTLARKLVNAHLRHERPLVS